MNEIEIKNKITHIEKAIEIFTTHENITDTEKTLSLKVLEKRKSLLSCKSEEFGSGALWKFSQTVGSARYGAVTHPGARKEKKIYSDI